MLMTDEQRDIINSCHPHLSVSASAGAGKTEVLVRRVIELLRLDPSLLISDVAIITFTNRAAGNVKDRLSTRLYEAYEREEDPAIRSRLELSVAAANSCFVGTIHSFCRRLLDAYGPLSTPNNLQIGPDATVTKGVEFEAVQDATFAALDANGLVEHLRLMPMHELQRRALDAYRKLLAKCDDVDQTINRTLALHSTQWSGQDARLQREWYGLLLDIHHRALALKARMLTLSPDDLLELCEWALRSNRMFRAYSRHLFRHVLVDEFQDTSLRQSLILRSLIDDDDGCGHGPSLFVVGDKKQSIYRFRGADVAAYHRAQAVLGILDAGFLEITANFRSTPQLLDWLNRTFSQLGTEYPDFGYSSMVSARVKPPAIPTNNVPVKWIGVTGGLSEQAEVVADEISLLLDNKVLPGSIAVLLRTNAALPPFYAALKDRGIDCRLVGPGLLFSRPEIRDVAKLTKVFLRPNTPLLTAELQKTIFATSSQFRLWVEEQQTNPTPKAVEWLGNLYYQTGIMRVAHEEVRANLYKLLDILTEQPGADKWSIYDFSLWLANCIASGADEDTGEIAGSAQDGMKVTISTIHRAKGLEFPVVFLPYLDRAVTRRDLYPTLLMSADGTLELCQWYYHEDSYVPSSGYAAEAAREKVEVISEELRILYVACTRAEEKLYLIGNPTAAAGKECPWTWLSRVCPEAPSPKPRA